jgi:NAD(P)-dependent dehydrogenase (short-subunit alcohol dehydrogenase family)
MEQGMTIERFVGRAAVITGGAAGAGRAVAQRLVREGCQVALWDLDDSQLALAAAETGAAFTCRVDVTDPEAVTAAAEATSRALGRIDLLMNSAGVTGATAPVAEYSPAEWRRVLSINLDSVFYCCRAIIPIMQASGYGRIVNMSSVGGKEGNPNAAAYAASKSGILGFTKALGKELATSGILVNAVTPAVFRTAMLDQMPQSQIDYMVSKIPMGRVGEVDEVAALVCWLLSDECSFSTAATFDISGGRATY